MPIDFGQFERIVQLRFKNRKLLEQAFTHRSYINENKRGKSEHNERLEFLGDAVLELVVTEHLFDEYHKASEGDLTAYRAALVNANTLSEVAKKLGMEAYLLLSKGESKDTGRARQFILANAFEALIGAVFLDQGYGVAKKFISDNLFGLVEKMISEKLWLDAKSHFQERAQEETGITPSYRLISEVGPDHDKHFNVGVFLGEEKVAEGQGKSKQEAEQVAARAGLEAKGWA